MKIIENTEITSKLRRKTFDRMDNRSNFRRNFVEFSRYDKLTKTNQCACLSAPHLSIYKKAGSTLMLILSLDCVLFEPGNQSSISIAFLVTPHDFSCAIEILLLDFSLRKFDLITHSVTYICFSYFSTNCRIRRSVVIDVMSLSTNCRIRGRGFRRIVMHRKVICLYSISSNLFFIFIYLQAFQFHQTVKIPKILIRQLVKLLMKTSD